jgi:uncharacterized protein YlaI
MYFCPFCTEQIAIGTGSKAKYETGFSLLTLHPVKRYAGSGQLEMN